ncbi:MAG: hypothetical protein JSS49_29680 [Planctomycetes bacterium]|nr:hypothetical protein [Planctomycetota bacterium]
MTEASLPQDVNPEPVAAASPPFAESTTPRIGRSWARRLPRLICSQNPFYLLSVCFVLHAAAQWFHRDSGESFSPWPLLGLIGGYIALLAATGFVIVRFGRVWDDARSILLLILLLFVELSLVFDETLVRNPATGRMLLLAGLGIAVSLSELLLRGLKIQLPWLFRGPYHLLLALLFLYPLTLVSVGTRISAETASWRIFLFPVAAALILLTILPAIRRGPDYTRNNGTPWLWPWYPWSLFVFLTVCIGFRAYALTLSFDPILSASLDSAMQFDSVFGTYFLVPLVLAAGALLLEVGLVSNRQGAIRLAMLVPLLSLYLSLPVLSVFGPYREFLFRLTLQVGSPIWLTLLAGAVFYGHAMLRRVAGSETMLALTLLAATRIGPGTLDITTLAAPQLWPLFVLAAVELALGLVRSDSHRVFVGLAMSLGGLQIVLRLSTGLGLAGHTGIPLILLLASVLIVGACYRDDFAWLLRLSGAPLILLATLGSLVVGLSHSDAVTPWLLVVFVAGLSITAWVYAAVVRMRLYHLASILSGGVGLAGVAFDAAVVLMHSSGWQGANSFALGLAWFLMAVLISCWKAGWLHSAIDWLQQMLILEPEHLPAT